MNKKLKCKLNSAIKKIKFFVVILLLAHVSGCNQDNSSESNSPNANYREAVDFDTNSYDEYDTLDEGIDKEHDSIEDDSDIVNEGVEFIEEEINGKTYFIKRKNGEISILDYFPIKINSFCEECGNGKESLIINSLLNDYGGKMETQIRRVNKYSFDESKYDTITTITVYNDTFEITKVPHRTYITKAYINSENLTFKPGIKIGMPYRQFADKFDILKDDKSTYSIITFENSSYSKLLMFFFSESSNKLKKIEYYVYLD